MSDNITKVRKAISDICCIYPTVKMYHEPQERLAGRIALILDERDAEIKRLRALVIERWTQEHQSTLDRILQNHIDDLQTRFDASELQAEHHQAMSMERQEEIERLYAYVEELEIPTYYWDDRDLDSAVEPCAVGVYDDVGDVVPFRPIHELPTRWALIVEDGVEWFDTENAARDEDVLLACRRGVQRCHECPDTGCCDNVNEAARVAAKGGGDGYC